MITDDQTVPPEGSDEDAKLWAEFEQADASGESAPTTDPAEPQPVAEPTGEKADATDPAATTKPEPHDDPWASAPETLRAEREKLQRERDEAIAKERRLAGSLPAQTRKINELLAENERLKAASAKPADGDPKTVPSEDPDLARAREDFPEIIGPLEKSNEQLRAEIAEIKTSVKARFDALDKQEQEAFKAQQAARLSEKHPDWQQIANSSSFDAWAQKQPPMVQQAIADSVDAAEISLVLSLYKQTTAKPNPPAGPPPGTPKPPASDKRSVQMESATTPRTKGPAKVASGLPDPDDAEGAWKYYEELDRRREAGSR